MRRLVCLTTGLLISSCQTPARLPASVPLQHPSMQKSEQGFAEYIAAYSRPEFIDDNEAALLARVKLIDQIPSGGTAKVMTFVHDNGYATKLLAAHLCLAAKRSVRVQYLTDSKSGDRPGVDDMFDEDPHNKVNEELYQMLANCGVEVKVHNHIEKFDISGLSGKHTPHLPQSWKSRVVGRVWSKGGRAIALADLARDFDDVTDRYVKSANLPERERKRVETIFLRAVKRLARVYFTVGTQEALVEEMARMITEGGQDSSGAALWRAERGAAAEKFLRGYLEAIRSHPRLGEFYRQARVVNRLNHRKLFHVSYGERACMFLGGRNLGDHYLTWDRHHNEFMDGDVFICDQHQAPGEGERITRAAEASFDQLWNNEDSYDPVGVPPVLTTITPNYRYQYRYLRFPERREGGWGNLMWIFLPRDPTTGEWIEADFSYSARTPVEGLKDEDRMLVAPMEWKDLGPVRGTVLADVSRWRVRTSTWNTAEDKVRAELEAAIGGEQERAYIETAYSEFNSRIRRAIESALQRGVRVEVVTNSIFVADGGSKAIRLLMARWTRQMLEKYGSGGKDLFTIKYATLAHGHMIHFKGASFACQSGAGDRVYRLNLVGSHNFHGRSGYSDKEHALIWEQPPKQSCADKTRSRATVSSAEDLRDLRNAFYVRRAEKSASVAPLKAYATLAEEFNDALQSGQLPPERAKLAKAAMKAIYGAEERPDGSLEFKTGADGRAVVVAQDSLFAALEVVSESGLSDLLGALL